MTAKRRDNNHAEIRDALRKVYQVVDTADLGDGFPDLLVVSRIGNIVLFENKVIGAKLTPDEVKFHEWFRGPLHVVYNTQEAFDVMESYN